MAKKFSKPHLSRIINGDIEIPEEIKAEKKPRLDAILAEKYPQYSRATLQKFIRNLEWKIICAVNRLRRIFGSSEVRRRRRI